MGEEFIRIHELNKYYNKGTKREVHAINNTSLTLPDKGLVCILGESGSGKTTLMHAIGAQDTFASGMVEIAGKKLTGRMNKNAEQVRNEEYGFVFQNYYLLSDETVYENLKLALCLYELSKEQQDERINYVLEAVDMIRYKKRKVSALSGGQRQRVAIARALVRTPRVIFADEPVGNLDENNTMLVMGILKKVSRNTLIVLTTHEKRLARFFADRIIQVYDGKVVSNEENIPLDSYQLSDDNNIYLGEYQKHNVLSDEVAIEAYGSFDEPLTMQIVECGGKYYFSLPEGTQAEFLTKDSEIQLKQGKRLALELEEVENRSYELPRLSPKEGGMLSAKQIASMVLSAFGSGRKKLLFPLLCMFLTAVLTAISISDFLSLSKMKTEELAITHSKLLHVKIEKDNWIKSEEFTEFTQTVIDEFWDEFPEWTVYPVFSLDVSIRNESFEQVAGMSEFFSGYSYTPLSLFDESTLVYGRMPEQPNEVVVDQAVLEAFMARRNLVSQSFTDVRQFLDHELLVAKKNYNMVIVGISNGKEKAVYIDDMAGLGYGVGGTMAASLSRLQEAYPGQYDDIVLAEDEVLVNETRVEAVLGYKWFSDSYGAAYRLKGIFPDEFAATYVVSDELYETLLKRQILNVKEFVIYTEDKEGIGDYFYRLLGRTKLLDKIRITVTDDYGNRVSAFLAERNAKLAGRALITAMILLLSLIMLAISMKAMAMRNVENISVYRLLGIRGKSILHLYGSIIAALSVCSTLPGVLICAGVLHSVSGIEALQLDFSFGVPVMLLTILALFAANILVGLLPIRRIVKTPPAQLATKSDI